MSLTADPQELQRLVREQLAEIRRVRAQRDLLLTAIAWSMPLITAAADHLDDRVIPELQNALAHPSITKPDPS